MRSLFSQLTCTMIVLSWIAMNTWAGDDGGGDLSRPFSGLANGGAVILVSELSLKKRSGRFHKIHADELSMSCNHCHGGAEYKDDYLNLSKDRPQTKANPGRVEKSVCLGCHQQGGSELQLFMGNSK